MAGRGKHVLGGAYLDDVAGVHDDDSVSEVASRSEVVGDIEDGHTLVFPEPPHHVEDPDPDRDVEHRDRLVGEYQLRPDSQGLGETQPLALSPAQLVRVPGQHHLGRLKADGVHHAEGLGVTSRSIDVGPVERYRPHDGMRDAVGGVDRAKRVLEHHRHLTPVSELFALAVQGGQSLTIETHFPFGRFVGHGQHSGDGGFPAPALAHEGHDFLSADRKADVIHGVECLFGPPRAQVEVQGQVRDLQQRRLLAVLVNRRRSRWYSRAGHRGWLSEAPRRLPGQALGLAPAVLVQQAPYERATSRVRRRREGRTLRHRVGAAWVEPATRRRRRQVRRCAGDAGKCDLFPPDRGESLQ